jgi:hypothetical protein
MVAEKKPLVTILAPTPNEVIAPGIETKFIGAAYDVQNGMLPPSSLTWVSDRDGLLGHGQRLSVSKLSRGRHTITLLVTDKTGNAASARVSFVVGRERLVPTEVPIKRD